MKPFVLPYGPRYQEMPSETLVDIVERDGTQPYAGFFAALELARRKEYVGLHELAEGFSSTGRINARDGLFWHTQLVTDTLKNIIANGEDRFTHYEAIRHFRWITESRPPCTPTR